MVGSRNSFGSRYLGGGFAGATSCTKVMQNEDFPSAFMLDILASFYTMAALAFLPGTVAFTLVYDYGVGTVLRG